MKSLYTRYAKDAIDLLSNLIEIPSFSREEHRTADIIEQWFLKHNLPVSRIGNNVYCRSRHYSEDKPTLLLNSHHDTVQPNKGYTRDPYKATISDGKLYGLGSNDAGGCLVSLLQTFLHFYDQQDMTHNVVFVASAEEEISGAGGLAYALTEIGPVDVAIVGEPTKMQMAIAEKGLIVYDAVIRGTSSHAAHANNDNPIYKCIEALTWIKEFRFSKESPLLGPVKMTATQLSGGHQHNQIPSEVHLVIDVRVNDQYSNKEIDTLLQDHAPFEIVARSLRLSSSRIAADHHLIKTGVSQGRETYGSTTTSDQHALSCPSLKMGPGDTLRSHTADEFIYTQEIAAGIDGYISLLTPFLKTIKTDL